MRNPLLPGLKALALSAALLPLSAQAVVTDLYSFLGAANQNGSDPSLVTDSNGIVPTDATGFMKIQLDDEANTINMQLYVAGIAQSDLLNFGPNQSPIHLHNSAVAGNFGPIAIDPTFTADASNYSDLTQVDGFSFKRDDISILLDDQGGVQLGMHPGDDKIIDALLSGNMFVAVHTNRPIFTNTAPGRPDGFPFVEIRGNIYQTSPVPVPAALPLLGSGLIALIAVARRRIRA
ncbi:hypothetical protein MNBD_GAMMA11-840 [hydrothermal vent metagenome]|uniref:CHRD domain-containing protein n=1 Tax=hydrothermal vent metagenome TaxID=652676 RepID=A0A3B0X506_9ZZZZ